MRGEKPQDNKIWKHRFRVVPTSQKRLFGLQFAWISATIGYVGILPGFLPKIVSTGISESKSPESCEKMGTERTKLRATDMCL